MTDQPVHQIEAQIARQKRFFASLIAQPIGDLEGVRFVPDVLAGVPVEWTEPLPAPRVDDLVVLYLHGGGYSSGLAQWARRATARMALDLGCRVVAADYRLAPEFPFPAAHEDVLAVYQHLIGPAGFDAGRIAVAGDSAGGALTVSLMADARDRGLPQPACGLLNSLWADIAMNTPSLDDPVRNTFDIRRSVVEGLSSTLLSTGGVDPYDPRHSPVYRDMRGLNPLLIQAAGRDICHDDSVRLAASARAAGVEIRITEYPDVEHIWILNGTHRIHYPEGRVQWVDVGVEPPEAITAVQEMCAFVRAHVKGGVGP